MREDIEELREAIADLRQGALALTHSKEAASGPLIRATHALDTVVNVLRNIVEENAALTRRISRLETSP